MKEGYKKTELGWIPNEWKCESLSQLIKNNYINEVLDGNHGALYPRNEEFIEAGVPYISANSINNNRIDFSKAKYLSEERANKFKKGIAHNGDVLFAHNATVGPTALLETNLNKVILSTSLTYYRVNNKYINNKYLMYYMSSQYFVKQYSRRMSQTTRNQVPIGVQKEFIHLIPPLKEQEKIAEILSTVDSQIDYTDELIEKTKELKKGLMQRLLTKGIGHSEFKKTEVGEIPIEWDVKKISDITEIISGGTPKTNVDDYWVNGDILWATPTDITRNKKYINNTEKKITKAGLENSSANLLPIGTVLMCSRATIGARCINTTPMSTNQGFKSFICCCDKVKL